MRRCGQGRPSRRQKTSDLRAEAKKKQEAVRLFFVALAGAQRVKNEEVERDDLAEVTPPKLRCEGGIRKKKERPFFFLVAFPDANTREDERRERENSAGTGGG